MEIDNLNTYKDFFQKAKHDTERHFNDGDSYSLMDCFLTWNSLPEWIKSDQGAPDELKSIAREILRVMKTKFQSIDEANNGNDVDIDYCLRVIRQTCNHSKHGPQEDKPIPPITKREGASFPLHFPAKFQHTAIGDMKGRGVLTTVLDFWTKEIQDHQ